VSKTILPASRYTTNNSGLKKHRICAHALHAELQKVCKDNFSRVPDVRVIRFNPILRDIYNLTECHEEKRETHNEATKRTYTELIAPGKECHVRQPEQEQHTTVGDTQESAEDSDNVDFVPPVLPALAVPVIINERADFAVCTAFTGEEAVHVYDVTLTGVDEYTSGFADKGQ
jgi:hypothetical protein